MTAVAHTAARPSVIKSQLAHDQSVGQASCRISDAAVTESRVAVGWLSTSGTEDVAQAAQVGHCQVREKRGNKGHSLTIQAGHSRIRTEIGKPD